MLSSSNQQHNVLSKYFYSIRVYKYLVNEIWAIETIQKVFTIHTYVCMYICRKVREWMEGWIDRYTYTVNIIITIHLSTFPHLLETDVSTLRWSFFFSQMVWQSFQASVCTLYIYIHVYGAVFMLCSSICHNLEVQQMKINNISARLHMVYTMHAMDTVTVAQEG